MPSVIPREGVEIPIFCQISSFAEILTVIPREGVEIRFVVGGETVFAARV
jgi:hypothetical protein